jgi:hypothetical protein
VLNFVLLIANSLDSFTSNLVHQSIFSAADLFSQIISKFSTQLLGSESQLRLGNPTMRIFSLIFAVLLTSMFVMALDRWAQEFFINLLFATFASTSKSPITENFESFEFPDDFMFGVASSAFQIEGSWADDGKSASMWDVFTHEHPELVFDGSTADIGPNSYRFYSDDVAAIKAIGVISADSVSTGEISRFFVFSFITIASLSRGHESCRTGQR